MEQCLLSVQAALNDIDGEIIVVDNGSTDGSKTFFEDWKTDIPFQYFYNNKNAGFGAANNQALKIARGDYILFLNPDTLIPEDCFVRCIDFLKSKNNEAALGVRMLDGAGHFLKESKRAFPDPFTSLFKLSGLSSLFPKSNVFARYHLGHLDPTQIHEIDVLAGAFIFLHRNVLEKVKGFDEDFFMYGEDIDLSYRIQKAGFSNYYFPEVSIIHFKGESTKKGSLNYVKMFYRAMSVFAKKHYGGSKAGLFNLFIQFGIAIRATLSAVSRFLKWVGMPVIDIFIIFLCFWLVKWAWAKYLLHYLAYDQRILLITYPAFTILYLITSYYSGVYDNGYRQSRLNRAILITTLILFTIYALVPESTQFSRGMLLSAVGITFILLSAVRYMLVGFKVIQSAKPSDREKTVIAGSIEEYNAVMEILKNPGQKEVILGRISLNGESSDDMQKWKNHQKIFDSGAIDEIIFCEGAVSFKKIIRMVEELPKRIKASFFASGSSSIIGSRNKNETGEYRAAKVNFRLSNPLYRRVKRLMDALMVIAFLVTFPVHLIFKKRAGQFMSNCWQILWAQKSFITYSAQTDDLPRLKEGVLTTTGLPTEKNLLPYEVLSHTDYLYAKNYSALMDLSLILKGYKFLS